MTAYRHLRSSGVYSMSQRIFLICCIAVIIASMMPALANDKQDKLFQTIAQITQPLEYENKEFSGEAWKTLLAEGKKAQFFLLGEEHGIAENPELASQLFNHLIQENYRHLIIEVSPQIAQIMEQAIAVDGLSGIQKLFSTPGGEPAFFGMAEEAQMLVDIKANLPDDANVFWGVDYEVASDRQLLGLLQKQDVPEKAIPALNALIAASEQSWQQYHEKKNPQFIFSFSGDPELVAQLRADWDAPTPEVDWILDELEQTLSINQYWVKGQGWQSNQARVDLLRQNFLRHWHAVETNPPKLMAKLGASHLMRGLSSNRTFDLGTLLPELAEIVGGHSVSMMVLPGADSQVAVLDPVNWVFRKAPAKDAYHRGLEDLYAHAENGMTLIPTKPIRPLINHQLAKQKPELKRAVFGFDYILIMTGSTPSGELPHE